MSSFLHETCLHFYLARNLTRVDEGRKCLILVATTTKARVVVGRGEKGPLCDPGSELLLGGSARECEDNKWDEENEIKIGFSTPTPHLFFARRFPSIFANSRSLAFRSPFFTREKIPASTSMHWGGFEPAFEFINSSTRNEIITYSPTTPLHHRGCA